MAHPNEFWFLSRFLREWPSTDWLQSFDGARVLNIGTADHGAPLDYGSLFPGRTLVGLDAVAGPRVDVVCDLTGDCAALQGERFAAVLCCSVLEHCARPWLAATNIENHLLPFGLLYVTVPWIWRRHDYPHDYWRMSAEAVRLLFPRVRWKRIAYVTQAPNEIVPEGCDSRPPWRTQQDDRVYLASQLLCMIGRIS